LNESPDVANTVILNHATLAENVATRGGAIANFFLGFVTLENCILWANLPDAIFPTDGSASTVNSTIIQGGHSGKGNQNIDPRFRMNIHEFPYMLGWNSPAIDAALTNGVSLDLLSNPRPQN